jgi:hypothetical protein
MFTDVSEERDATVFRIEDEDGRITFLRDVGRIYQSE